MEKYPDYVHFTAKPFVFILGNVDTEPDIHQRIIRILEGMQKDHDNQRESNQLIYRSVSHDHNFPEKKPPKEILSTEGILKYNWAPKYYDSIPSVVIFTAPFSVDWSANEWSKREASITERFQRLKNQLSPREIKIVVTLIKIGSGIMEKDVIDERVSTLKKKLQIESKSFIFLNVNEIQLENNSLKRIAKHIREYSITFYTVTIKKFKTIEKGLNDKFKGILEIILSARFNFKMGFLNEFLGQSNYSLRYYRQCYNTLASSIDTIDEELYEQAKTIAEIAHFKACNILLSSNNIEEAFQQFKIHRTTFSKMYSEFPWKHYAWLADQYIIFEQLLDLYGISEQIPYGDRSFYLHNAAKYTQKRENSFEKIKQKVYEQNLQSTANPIEDIKSFDTLAISSLSNSFKGLVLLPPKYLGSIPLFLDPILNQLQSNAKDSFRVYTDYLQVQEFQVNHHLIIIDYLQQAINRVDIKHKRRANFLKYLLAEENMKQELYQEALEIFWSVVDDMTNDDWHYPAMHILQQILVCSTYLAKPSDYVKAALLIYTNSAFQYYIRSDLELLHVQIFYLLFSDRNIMTKLDSSSVYIANTDFVVNKAAFTISSFTPLLLSNDYGKAKPQDINQDPLQELTPFTVKMTSDNRLFDVCCQFYTSNIEMGQKLKVTVKITSKLIDTIIFDELNIVFLEDSYIKKYQDNRSKIELASNANKQELTFIPNKSTIFTFEIEVNEDNFVKFLIHDTVFCLERIELIKYRNNKKETGLLAPLTFNISTFPKTIERQFTQLANDSFEKDSSKPFQLFYHMKDLCLFNPLEQLPFVVISKPHSLVKVSEFELQNLEVLAGALKRIDIPFEIGNYDLNDIRIYLSSDFIPTRPFQEGNSPFHENSDALFWTPSFSDLSSISYEQVSFHPFLLNSSFQPLHPLTIPGTMEKHSKFSIPIFIRPQFNINSELRYSLSLKLIVECVPFQVMTSSVTIEIPIEVKVIKPFNISFNLSSLIETEKNPFSKDTLLINSTMKSLSFSHDPLVISEFSFCPFPANLYPSSSQLLEFIEKKEPNEVQKSDVQLKPSEEFSQTFYFSQKSFQSSSYTPDNATGTASQYSLLSPGVLKIVWTHINNHPLVNSKYPLSDFSWVTSPFLSLPEDNKEHKIFHNLVKLHPSTTTYLIIPQLQVDKKFFDINIIFPKQIEMGKIMEILIQFKNKLPNIEKVSITTFLHEHFLISGITSSILEVNPRNEESIIFRVLPLKPGFLRLPRIVCVWERGGLTLFDSGEGESDRDYVYVSPNYEHGNI